MYDLHIHTSHSDGLNTPSEILIFAEKLGVTGISITDHDTVDGYSEDIFSQAKDKNIVLVCGVEISSLYGGNCIHLLCYFTRKHLSVVNDFCEKNRIKKRMRNIKIIDNLSKKSIYVDCDCSKNINRQQIARSMVKKGYATSIEESFRLWIGDGKACFELGEYVGTVETIDFFHSIGGKVVLAHPYVVKNRRLLGKLLNLNFDGIEYYYGKNIRFRTDFNIDRFVKTGGSDYHGNGGNILSSYTNQENFDRLMLE